MNWQDLKASLQAFFQSFTLPYLYQQEPELKPVPVETRPVVNQPRRR